MDCVGGQEGKIMKISDVSHNIGKIGSLETAVKKQKEEDGNAAAATSASIPTSERVDLSKASVEYSNAAEKVDEVPKERADKIESLRMRVSNGTYNVDSRKIAEKIVNDSLFNAVEP
jgi:flagellar biosynthesis anti-sigma factor FlgM